MLAWLKSKFGRTKTAPRGLGPYSMGDQTGAAYVDAYGKVRQPTRAQLVSQYRNAVYVCCNLNADGVASVPLKLYVQTKRGQSQPKCHTKALDRRTHERVKTSSAMTGRVMGDPDIQEVPDHPLLDLLTKPNPYMSWTDLCRLTSLYLDIVGSAFWDIGSRSGLGTPSEIWPIPSHQCFPWREDMTSDTLITSFLFTGSRTQVKIPAEDIVHFKLTNLWEPYSMGYSPLSALWEPVGVSEAHYGHMRALLDNQARPDALLTPDDVIGEQERRRLDINLNNKFRGGGGGGILVTEGPMKLSPLGWSPIDLGVFESLGITKDMIADAYGVPQALLTKDTNLANLQASLTQHARFGIAPRVRARDEVINRYLIPLYDDSGRLFVCSDNPVPDDETVKTAKAVAYVGASIWTPNEARVKDGMEPREGGDETAADQAQKIADKTAAAKASSSQPVGAGGASGGKPPKKDKKGKKNDSPKSSKKGMADEVSKLYDAVSKSLLPLPVAYELVRQNYGMEVAIPFEECAKAIPVEKDLSRTDIVTQWACDRLDALPSVAEGDRVPVPFPVVFGAYTKPAADVWENRPVGSFIMRELVATQPTVARARVRELIHTHGVYQFDEASEADEVSYVVIVAGRYYLHEGHHHCTAAWLLGRSEVRARFLEVAPGVPEKKEFDESKHPRGEGGKFGDGSGAKREAAAKLATVPIGPPKGEAASEFASLASSIKDAAQAAGTPEAESAALASASDKGAALIARATERAAPKLAKGEAMAKEVADARTALGPRPEEPADPVYDDDMTDEQIGAVDAAHDAATEAHEKEAARWDAASDKLDARQERADELVGAAVSAIDDAFQDAAFLLNDAALDAKAAAEFLFEEEGDDESEEEEEEEDTQEPKT